MNRCIVASTQHMRTHTHTHTHTFLPQGPTKDGSDAIFGPDPRPRPRWAGALHVYLALAACYSEPLDDKKGHYMPQSRIYKAQENVPMKREKPAPAWAPRKWICSNTTGSRTIKSVQRGKRGILCDDTSDKPTLRGTR